MKNDNEQSSASKKNKSGKKKRFSNILKHLKICLSKWNALNKNSNKKMILLKLKKCFINKTETRCTV